MKLKILIAILVIAVGGYFLYQHFFKKTEEVVETPQVVEEQKVDLNAEAMYKLLKETQKLLHKARWTSSCVASDVKNYQDLLNFVQSSNLDRQIISDISCYVYMVARWIKNETLAEQCKNSISDFDSFFAIIKEPCPMCGDKGEYTCAACGGTKVCGRCGGKGYIQRGELQEGSKYKKLGSRRDTCPKKCQYCHETGKITCTKCEEYANFVANNTLLKKIPEYYARIDKKLTKEIKKYAAILKGH